MTNCKLCGAPLTDKDGAPLRKRFHLQALTPDGMPVNVTVCRTCGMRGQYDPRKVYEEAKR